MKKKMEMTIRPCIKPIWLTAFVYLNLVLTPKKVVKLQ